MSGKWQLARNTKFIWRIFEKENAQKMMTKNRQAKFHFSPLLIMMAIMLLCGCRESLPVSTIKYTQNESEALRSVKVVRAAMMEMDAREPEAKAATMEQLCRQLSLAMTQERFELAGELPASCLCSPEGASGTAGGYRYVLVRGNEEGVYAIPEPDFAAARFAFYARLPAGLFLCRMAEFRDLKPVSPPDTKADAAWRTLPVIK